MTLIYILLCLFIVFVLVPLVKAFLFVRKIRKQNKDFFDQMRRASSQAAPGPDNRRHNTPGGAQAGTQGFGFDPLSFFFFDQMFGGDRTDASGQETKTKAKKIDPDVGEYVDFQEIEGEYRSTPGDDDVPYITNDSCEGYIQDVEWEDIDDED